jgi:hypothetical protein
VQEKIDTLPLLKSTDEEQPCRAVHQGGTFREWWWGRRDGVRGYQNTVFWNTCRSILFGA